MACECKWVRNPTLTALDIGIGAGVFWAVWGKYGFWWALLYGTLWETWFGYRLASWLLS